MSRCEVLVRLEQDALHGKLTSKTDLSWTRLFCQCDDCTKPRRLRASLRLLESKLDPPDPIVERTVARIRAELAQLGGEA